MRQVTDEVAKLRTRFPLVRIDRAKCPSLFDKYAISHMPALVKMQHGKIVATYGGVHRRKQVAAFVNSRIILQAQQAADRFGKGVIRIGKCAV